MKTRILPIIILFIFSIFSLFLIGNNAVLAAQGVPGGGGGGGGGGGHTESTANNLSYPAVYTGETGSASAWTVQEGTLGVTYSYGCDTPETIGTTTYPNTSCVSDDGQTFYTAEECTMAGEKCEGLQVDRIYWQKITDNYWQAASRGPLAPVTVAYLDWGDSLESRSWLATSIIRVETTPFASFIPGFDPTTMVCADTDPCQVGYQMWHVFGQGTTEQWGARATDAAVALAANSSAAGRQRGQPADNFLPNALTISSPYVYYSPFAIIHTANARLNMAKLEQGIRTCPDGGGVVPDPSFFVRAWGTPGWTSTCTLRDIPYSAELNVQGKYVYGYNWMLRRDEMPSNCGSGWDKAGWWRLTFYADNGVVFFDQLSPVLALAPPPSVPSSPLVVVAAETGDSLYAPVIDYANNLTYIDICIKAKTGGGGKKPR
jgi:hypothetical protein